MPLERESDICDPENLVGVRFVMCDASDKKKRVICLVTYAALKDRAAADGNGDDWLRAWHEHRHDMDVLASAKYDNKQFEEDGTIKISYFVLILPVRGRVLTISAFP
jgi:hypothetical protein